MPRESQLNATYLTVVDLKRSIRFYKKLGFEVGHCWPDARKPKYASLVLDRQVIMVATPPTDKDAKKRGAGKTELRRIKKDRKAFKKHPHGVGVQIYLSVPDPDAHHGRARRNKVVVLRSPETHAYGVRDYVAVDPDGYRLVFFALAESTAEVVPAMRRKVRGKAAPKPLPQATPEPAAMAAPQ